MDSIFKHFIEHESDNEKRLTYAYWFVKTFPKTEFEGEELLFYHFMDYCVNLNSPLKDKYLDVFTSTELRPIIISEKVRVQGTESLLFDDPTALESAVRISATVLKDNYKALLTLDADINDFAVDMQQYMERKLEQRLIAMYTSGFDILQNTDDKQKVLAYTEDQTALIRNIYDIDNLRDIVDTPMEEGSAFKVTEFGLPAIDKDSDGIWSGQLVGVEAQPGTGKTRFAVNLMYNAAVLHKRNCAFYTLEQSKQEIEAMFIAKHIFTMFNIVIEDRMILRNIVPDEYKSQVEAARIDLFELGKYGKIVIYEAELYVETFINELKNNDKMDGPFHFITIDYMGIIDSRGELYHREKQLYDIVKSSYRQFKRYVRKSNKAGLAISQFNREGVEAGQNDKQITTSMAEGGQAVYRNTDYNIAMSMTETMKLQQRRRLSQPKVRGSAGFGSIIIDTRLGFCYFKQHEQKEV